MLQLTKFNRIKILTQTVFYCIDLHGSNTHLWQFMYIYCVEIKIVVANIGIISHPQIFYGYASTYSLLKERISPQNYFNNIMFVIFPFDKENIRIFSAT